MEPSERHFYHSFPRLRPNDERAYVINTGIAILESIQRFGLFLAPEVITWNQPLEDGNFRTTTTNQHRICFTELSSDEVRTHGARFGPFSIQIRIEDLRTLGDTPVIYVPQTVNKDVRFSAIGLGMVTHINDIEYTLNQLSNLKQLTNIETVKRMYPDQVIERFDENCVFNLNNVDGKGNVVASYQISMKTIEDFLSYLGFRNAPFDLMLGVLSHVKSLFYPTDDVLHDKALEYYRQREWRLLPGLTSNGQVHSRALTEEEKNTLLSVNERFWSRELTHDNVTLRRVDDTFCIDSHNGRHITEMISSVIVPQEAEDMARTLFGDRVQAYEWDWSPNLSAS